MKPKKIDSTAENMLDSIKEKEELNFVGKTRTGRIRLITGRGNGG